MKRKSFKPLLFVIVIFVFLQIDSYAADIFSSHWSYENYMIAKEDNWVIGEDGGGFSFDKPSSRERAVTTLVQAWEIAVKNGKTNSYLKSAPADTLNNFTDASRISPRFKDAVATAVANGIIKGDANRINPKSSITRAEFAVILSRIAKTNIASGKSVFKDKLPDWARDGILKAYSTGLIKGYSDNTFKPQLTITNAEALTMIKRWAYGEDIYTFLTDAQLQRLKAYPEIQGNYHLSNIQYRKAFKEELRNLAKAAKEYMTVLGTYNYKDFLDISKKDAFRNIYLKYCNFSPENSQIIDAYINDAITNKRIKSTRFLLSSSTVYRCGTFKGACIRGIEEFKMLEGTPEDDGTKTGKTYQRDVELQVQQTATGIAVFDIKYLSAPVLVK